ncbi:MAG: pyruvate ferredoxin oxidoreductase [Candidatus Moranbacteria bacterium]|nr:pyruvate ferredoxin oxidoreductase [Candidatus Moranbacteria bacterium]
MNNYQAKTGAEAVAEAMRQINPDVVPVYPITPQTPIVETFSKMVANKGCNSEIIHVESEHSAMSAAVGSAAAGARTMTASSSAGLALMFEILGVASGLRLPIVMNIANRALSAPINIHCDHSDSMGVRDSGWIQIYSRNAEEVYDNNFLALKLAEQTLLPAMIMQDGFITSHSIENVELLNDEAVRDFIGEKEPSYSLLNTEKPITIGALQLPDYFFETKYQHIDAMNRVSEIYDDLAKSLKAYTNREYPKLETFGTKDAEAVIIVLNSTAMTVEAVAKKMREEGKKVGLIAPRLFLPFPQKELIEELEGINFVAVLDRAASIGSEPPLVKEVKTALYSLNDKPNIQSYIYGLGGRDIFEKDIQTVFDDMLQGKISEEIKYIGLRD